MLFYCCLFVFSVTKLRILVGKGGMKTSVFDELAEIKDELKRAENKSRPFLADFEDFH